MLLQPLPTIGELPPVEPPKVAVSSSPTEPVPHDWIRLAFTGWLLVGALGIIAAILSGISGELLRNPTASLTVGAVITLWFNELKGALAFYFGREKDHAVPDDANVNHTVH
ncbi:hypothetical protein BDI4_190017 [Burkholderia diffusa]|uniref:hypothetical protein n=1 Tax=Burkholderia diffusa TaxID=488732 RepID=UPI001CB03E48|nr:hypothetical protein [Burkholderia diffusa]CAG9245780.1 hypothetical protein BDI4_190017 [Burkholderia diffusa]